MASKLIHIAPHEAKTHLEFSLQEAFHILETQLRPPFSLSIPSQEQYFKLNSAILYAILTEPHFYTVHIKHLHGIITDGYAFFTSKLTMIVNEIYLKLIDPAKIQLIRIVHEMVNVSAIGFDYLLVALLRQITGGDFSEGNLWLCMEIISLFESKYDCLLEEAPFVLTNALYVFLRLLSDHYKIPTNPKIEALKRKEIDFCVKLLKNQFNLCSKIGRDLVRLLQDLIHIPEFRIIWNDLLLNQSEISQLYRTRTSSRYFLLRISPEMESQIRFLLTNVKFGTQKRHQFWFARKFLSIPERESRLIDIIRFICCAHHPSNEILQSDIIPRWAVIGWLITLCRNKYIEGNIKLALFYDWLFFNEKTDNIMNIEPAILLMVNSIPKYMNITHNLLEFLLILVDSYDVKRKDMIVRGVVMAFDSIVKKGVIQSFDVLTRCERLAPFLKERLVKLLENMQGLVQGEVSVKVCISGSDLGVKPMDIEATPICP